MAEQAVSQENFVRGNQLLGVSNIAKQIREGQISPSESKVFLGGLRQLNSGVPILEESILGNMGDVQLTLDTLSDVFTYFDRKYFLDKYDMSFHAPEGTGAKINYILTRRRMPRNSENAAIDREIRSFLDLGTEVLHKNLGRVEEMLRKSDDPEFIETALRSVTFLARAGKRLGNKEEVVKDAVDFLTRVFDKNALLTLIEKFNIRKIAYTSPVFSTIFACGDASQAETAKKIAVDLLKDEDANTRRNVCFLISQGNSRGNWDTSGNAAADILTSAFGLDGKELLEFFKSAPIYDSDSDVVTFVENVFALSELEHERPGIGKILQSEFGINLFARYPKDLLIAQYDERQKNDLPYGVIILPQHDRPKSHPGAFYSDKSCWEKLFKQLLGKFRLRVFEVSSSLELIRALNNARHNFGKISFAFIGGHGEQDNIRFGKNPEDLLSQKEVLRKGAAAVRLAFTDNATIILNSCSTGALGGIGQEISRISQARIIAPPEPIAHAEINAQINPEGIVNFEVKYEEEDVSPQIYKGGALDTNLVK